MKILIIGGTKFSGRHLVDSALSRNHEVTIFHRGNHPSGDLGDVEEILGDRNYDLGKLEDRTWDVVVDMCGYLPQWVASSTKALKNATSQYVFISSVSAYDDLSRPNFDESTRLAKLTAEQEQRFTKIDPKGDFVATDLGDMYGALKVLCEEEAHKGFPDNNLIIRPGLIVGKHDFTDRFTYWVMRIARGGEVLAPADPEAFVQFIDAKDLAEWLITLIENRQTGIFNAVNKPFELTFGRLLATIKEVSKSNAKFTWVSDEFMAENDLTPWTEMPLHIPESKENPNYMKTANIDRALAKGLTIRAPEQTIADTLAWRQDVDWEMRAGISLAREAGLLRKWHEQSNH